MVELIEWTDFVKYLDERRGARSAAVSRGAPDRVLPQRPSP